MSIKVENLTKVFGKDKAVDTISFEAKKGRILGFLGPNGAGKSTTMKMLTTFIKPTSGHAYLAGLDIAKDPLQIKKIIGYLPENNPLYKDMYVKEFLSFVADIYYIKDKKSRIDLVIEQTGLLKEQHKKIQTLSKGYKQRVGLAQAIIHEPEILILDEPTSGLDPNQLIEIRQLIKNLATEKTVIFSTHIMQEVEAICDDVVIINEGEIVANDTLENLLSQYQCSKLEDVFVQLTQKKDVRHI